MSPKSDPWFVQIATYLSYVVVLAAGVWIGHAFWRGPEGIERSITLGDNQPLVIANKELLQVNSSSDATKILNLNDSSWVEVEVEELGGKNIAFEALQDGRTIHSSGIQHHVARGRFRALPGLCTIKVLNENLIDSKQVAMTVRASPLR